MQFTVELSSEIKASHFEGSFLVCSEMELTNLLVFKCHSGFQGLPLRMIHGNFSNPDRSGSALTFSYALERQCSLMKRVRAVLMNSWGINLLRHNLTVISEPSCLFL